MWKTHRDGGPRNYVKKIKRPSHLIIPFKPNFPVIPPKTLEAILDVLVLAPIGPQPHEISQVRPAEKPRSS